MIQGAVDYEGKELGGHYKPAELGRMTIWQMKHVFGYRGRPNPKTAVDVMEDFWQGSRRKGQSEFEIWRRWADEVKPFMGKKK